MFYFGFPLLKQDTELTPVKVLEESSSAVIVSELLLSLADADADVLESFPTRIHVTKLIWTVKLKYSLSVNIGGQVVQDTYIYVQ